MKLSPLNQITEDIFDQLGGKAKGLFLLENRGFHIPTTFVLYDIKENEDYEVLREYWKEINLTNVAVRSSATQEDGIDFSSAGQYETFLNIKDVNSFMEAVKGCVASLHNETIQSYRSFFLQDQSEMCIVVQEMVDAAFAGVAFSRNPLGNEEEVVIEAVAGLGEQLVSGVAKADSIMISKETPKFTKTELLSLEQVKELYHDIMKAEQLWEMPIDLEWAINQEEKLLWLQARPITTTDSVTIDELDTPYEVENDVITNHNVGEMLPGAITPLTISTVVYSIDYGLRKMMTIVGVAKKIEEVPEELCISHYQGHLFFNMRYLYRMSGNILRSTREEIDLGICGKVLDTNYKEEPSGRGKLSRVYYTIRYFKYLLSRNKARKRVDKRAKKLSFDFTQSLEDLYQEIDRKKTVLNDVLSDHYITSAHSGAMSTAIFTILKQTNENHDEIKGQIACILEDIDGIESVDILQSLKTLARAMKEDNPDCMHYSEQELLSYLTDRSSQVVKAAYHSFLTKHGHRSVKEAELRNPGWKDNLLGLMNYLKMILTTNLEEVEKDPSNLEKNIEVILQGQTGGTRKALKYLIKQARIGCRNREYSKSRIIYATDKFKTAYQILAEKMVEAQLLPDADLIYFLKHDEIKHFINRDDMMLGLLKKCVIRKRLFKEQEQLQFQSVNIGKPQLLTLDFSELGAGTELKGTPLSRGQVIGTARIVKSMEDAKTLQPGEIMVAGYTDIGWSPYYALISGLVTEVGSALSHGAVVAREYALPLVANISYATQKIKTGDRIALDGNKGTVTLLEA